MRFIAICEMAENDVNRRGRGRAVWWVRRGSNGTRRRIVRDRKNIFLKSGEKLIVTH